LGDMALPLSEGNAFDEPMNGWWGIS